MNKAGLSHLIEEKPTSIVVSGVGKDAEKCSCIQSVPGVLEDGTVIQYEAPRIPKSSVPALCGMQTLDEQNMAVLPWSSQLAKVPKGKEHEIKWPEGTTFLQCRRANTGHMMLPIGNFDKLKEKPTKASHLAFTADYIIERQKQFESQPNHSNLSVTTYSHVPSVNYTVGA